MPYTCTFKLWTCKDANVSKFSCPVTSVSARVGHTWKTCAHPSGGCVLRYFTGQHLLQFTAQNLNLKPRTPASRCKSSGDVAGTSKVPAVLYCSTTEGTYCKIKNVLFLYLFFMYYLCEKYCKPITVQYYIANCVSWVPRLTLMDLNWTFEHVLGMKLICV